MIGLVVGFPRRDQHTHRQGQGHKEPEDYLKHEIRTEPHDVVFRIFRQFHPRTVARVGPRISASVVHVSVQAGA